MYNFKEAQLKSGFAKEKLHDFKTLIEASVSFVAISMPGVGVSYFLRYLATQTFAYFIHIDLYLLPTLSQHEFYKLLLSELGGKIGSKDDGQMLKEAQEILSKLSRKHSKIVLIFSRFDQLKDYFDWNFLSNLQSLVNIATGKIVEIFTSTKPLSEITPDSLSGGNLNFYSENLYFKPFSKEDLKMLCQIEPAKSTPPAIFDYLLDLSGGHNQLLHILLSSQKQQNLLLDQFVKMQMKELVDYLDYFQRKQLQRIAMGKTITEVDDYLLGIGMVKSSKVKDQNSTFELFSPLLTEYIKTSLPVRLPVKEEKLFKLLKEHLGKTVNKDEIFTAVWGENATEATDWALDALIYRLRKHPFMKANGYIIESHKKIGYTLVQVK